MTAFATRAAVVRARHEARLLWIFVVTQLQCLVFAMLIFAFHLLGLGLELFKVSQGSWSYPDAGVTMVAGCRCTRASCTPRWARICAKRGVGSTCASPAAGPVP